MQKLISPKTKWWRMRTYLISVAKTTLDSLMSVQQLSKPLTLPSDSYCAISHHNYKLTDLIFQPFNLAYFGWLDDQ